MRKIFLSGALIVCLLLGACGNGKPSNISQEVYDIGLDAVETIEMYQDGKMAQDEAVNRLKSFTDAIDAAMDENNIYESNVKTYVEFAGYDINLGESGIDRLNALKKELGVD